MQFNYNIYQDGDERAKRQIGPNDRAVVLRKPLGLVLEEAQDGMVFVANMEQGGNAMQSGQINVGDILVAVSATFGDEVWSVRGVGLDRVMKSIRVRSGDFVTLVLESSQQVAQRKMQSIETAKDRREFARETFGEREVIDPNSWTKFRTPEQQAQGYANDSELEAQLQNEQEEEGGQKSQDWILYASAGIGVALILGILVLSKF
eukprot:CAMPEP_0184706502 /NCGR_PEP_ID=MMETSP0313-20130426/36792_1 /TAXON_ID=2792 /ORGANISM="Porphyridium aerugineum, Strain SAG 1380-2" /LENGTH=204 /DNA_ID=CAMNT_0027168055 /DNA_START=1397 /DNA_END=2011 /DNA_ORIENTATION=+